MLIGGVAAAIVGPQVVIVTKDLWPPYLFAATYLAQAAIAVIAGLHADAAENSDAARAHQGAMPGGRFRRSRGSRNSSSPWSAASPAIR